MPDTARLVKLLDAAESNMFCLVSGIQYPVQNWKCMGSRVLPCQSPPTRIRLGEKSQPIRRPYFQPILADCSPDSDQSRCPNYMPTVCCQRLGTKSNPPKLLIRSCSPRFRMLPMTDEKMPVRRLGHDIFVMVREGAHVRRSENGKPTG